MKKYIWLLAFCSLSFIETSAANNIMIDDIYIRQGDTLRVPIYLSNEVAFTAFQMDVFVPEGISIASINGSYVFTLGSRTSSTHLITSNSVKNGSVRVVVFSTNSDAFTEKSGELFFVDIVADNSFVAPRNLEIKNILFTSTLVQEFQFPDVTVPIYDYQLVLGDINGDGVVNVMDATALIGAYLNNTTNQLNMTVADVNHDGAINVMDATEIINIYLNNR